MRWNGTVTYCRRPSGVKNSAFLKVEVESEANMVEMGVNKTTMINRVFVPHGYLVDEDHVSVA